MGASHGRAWSMPRKVRHEFTGGSFADESRRWVASCIAAERRSSRRGRHREGTRGRPRVRAVLIEWSDDAGAVVEWVHETGGLCGSIDGGEGPIGFAPPVATDARSHDW